MKKEITNRAEIVAGLAAMLRQFDIDLNAYQTDVYLYRNEDGTATLDTFVNVGGNSWLDDDHTTIYIDKQHYDTVYDAFEDTGVLVDAAGVTIGDIAKYYECEVEDIDRYYIEKYIDNNDECYTSVCSCYKDWLPDMGTYEEIADEIITGYENR